LIILHYGRPPIVYSVALNVPFSTTALFYRNGLLFSKFNKDHYRNAPSIRYKEENMYGYQ